MIGYSQDLFVEQVQQGNSPNNVIDKKTWKYIREEFNKQTGLNFNNKQLRKHLEVLRTRFFNLKLAYDQNDYPIDKSGCMAFDRCGDYRAQSRAEAIKVKDCPIYQQLCIIFKDTSVDGMYAQSSHYEGWENSTGNDASVKISHTECKTTLLIKDPSSAGERVKNIAERKRKMISEPDSSTGNNKMDQEELNESIAEALMDMLAASKWSAQARKNEEPFSITNCIKALDEIDDIDETVYLTALDIFENPNAREMFLSLQNGLMRLTWVQSKCDAAAIFL